jgi:hypothetical protein
MYSTFLAFLVTKTNKGGRGVARNYNWFEDYFNGTLLFVTGFPLLLRLTFQQQTHY